MTNKKLPTVQDAYLKGERVAYWLPNHIILGEVMDVVQGVWYTIRLDNGKIVRSTVFGIRAAVEGLVANAAPLHSASKEN